MAVALFDPKPEALEDFEEAWANDVWLGEFLAGYLSVALFGDAPAEPFLAGWPVEAFVWAWDAVTAELAAVDDGDAESFESGWTAVYAWLWTDVTSTAALFDEASTNKERFDGDWPAATTL